MLRRVCLCSTNSCFNLLYIDLKSMTFERSPRHLFRENLKMLFGEQMLRKDENLLNFQVKLSNFNICVTAGDFETSLE